MSACLRSGFRCIYRCVPGTCYRNILLVAWHHLRFRVGSGYGALRFAWCIRCVLYNTLCAICWPPLAASACSSLEQNFPPFNEEGLALSFYLRGKHSRTLLYIFDISIYIYAVPSIHSILCARVPRFTKRRTELGQKASL